MKFTPFFAFALFAAVAVLQAEVIKLPADDPVVSVTVPSSWTKEEIENGYGFESEDQLATVYFEVVPADKLEELIDTNIEWLINDQKVIVDRETETKAEFKVAGTEWSTISWDGKNDEWGPAKIILGFADAGKGSVLMVTYWVTKDGQKTHEAALNSIFGSVKTSAE